MSGIGAIVLAAGGSTRMGLAKQLLQYNGESFLRRACNAALKSNCRPVVAVLGCNHEELTKELAGLEVDIAINQNWQSGIGSSIRAGMQRLLELSPTIDAAVILLCDQPLVDANVIAKLLDEFQKSGKGVAASAYKNTIGPPVVARSEFFDALLKLPDDRGAKEIWLNNPSSVLHFSCAPAGEDIDTPAQYSRLQNAEREQHIP